MPNAVKFLVWDGIRRPKEDGVLNQAFAQGKGAAPVEPKPPKQRRGAILSQLRGGNQGVVALAPAPIALAVRVLETSETFYPRSQRAWFHVEIQNPEYVNALFLRVLNKGGSCVYQEVLDRDQAHHLPSAVPDVDVDPLPAAPDTSDPKQESLAIAADGPYRCHVWVARKADAFDACKRASTGVRDEIVQEEPGRTVGDQTKAVWADTAVANRLQHEKLKKAFAKGKKRPSTGPGIDRVEVKDAPRVEIQELTTWFTPGAKSKLPCRCTYLLHGHPRAEAGVGVVIHPQRYFDADGATAIADLVAVHEADEPDKVTAKGGQGSEHAFQWNGESSAARGLLAPDQGVKKAITRQCAPYTVNLRYAEDPADQQCAVKLTELWPTWDTATPPALQGPTAHVSWEVKGTDRLEKGELRIFDRRGTLLKKHDIPAADLAKDTAKSFAWDGKDDKGTLITEASRPLRVRFEAWSLQGGPKAVALAAMHTEVRAEAPRLSLQSLAAHFSPGAKTKDPCRLAYLLQGRGDPQSKVETDFYPRGYADIAGDGTETAIADYLTLRHQERPVPAWTDGQLPDPDQLAWDGQSDAARGALKVEGGIQKAITHRFAPYLCQLRYVQAKADEKASIRLDEFWPEWDDQTPAQLVAASKKVKWTVKDTDHLDVGQVTILGKDDRLIRKKDLVAADLTKDVAHEWDWDGKTEQNADITPDMRPFRVRIEAWSKEGGHEAVAVACLHTEVRGAPPKVEIAKLPKWFHPGPKSDGGEVCQIDWKVAGRRTDATAKVVMDIHASNHCTAVRNADATVTFTAIAAPKPILTDDLGAEKACLEKPYEIKTWRGESKATEGVLKPKANPKGGELPRFVNAAFSPYTIHLRYFTNKKDEKVRLDLKPFWPQWDNTPALKPDSLKVKWEIKDNPEDRITHGELVFFDKDDEVICTKPIKKADLLPGAKEHQWDGKHDDGATLITQDDMPVRVQMRAWMDYDPAKGGPHLALTAMHTEVRLFAAHEIPLDPAADPDLDAEPPSLELELAPLHPKGQPKADTEEDRWYQWKLAEAGYHPGPIDGTLNRPDCEIAIKEVQRSVPANTSKPYRRQAVTGAKSAETREVVRNLKAESRPWFGKPDDREDLKLKNVDLACNQEADREYILWVEDRHCYTEPLSGPAIADTTLSMENYRGGMRIGDGRTTKDEESTSRPWVPIQVAPRVLRAADQLDSPKPPDKKAKDGPYVGPIRIDWTFDEIGEDLSILPADGATIRTRTAVDRMVDAAKATVGTKDYKNCPVAHGGIRPATIADYYKAPFGLAADSLAPWRAIDDATAHKVCTLVHDDLGQADAELFDKAVGRAGVFLHTSRIAGDGYRFAAQLGLDAVPGSDFPNREVLKARYPKPPRAFTVKLRLWRKASMRGYVAWTKTDTKGWEATLETVRVLYRPSFVHFVHESGKSTPSSFSRSLVTKDEFLTVVRDGLIAGGSGWDAKARTYTDGFVWPFLQLRSFGVPPRPEDLATYQDWLSGTLETLTWDDYSQDLIVKLVDKIEKDTGYLRGHVFVEFASSPPTVVLEYTCNNCGHQVSEVANDPTSKKKYLGQSATSDFINEQCQTACGGTYDLSAEDVDNGGLPLCAIGRPLGATWLYQPRYSETWAHEAGHHRHLQHSANAPGFQPLQHDSAANPALNALHGAANLEQWDRHCIMSYNKDAPRQFCGKCVLKNRGWKVQGLANP